MTSLKELGETIEFGDHATGGLSGLESEKIHRNFYFCYFCSDKPHVLEFL
jgi:hypothetical protein